MGLEIALCLISFFLFFGNTVSFKETQKNCVKHHRNTLNATFQVSGTWRIMLFFAYNKYLFFQVYWKMPVLVYLSKKQTLKPFLLVFMVSSELQSHCVSSFNKTNSLWKSHILFQYCFGSQRNTNLK